MSLVPLLGDAAAGAINFAGDQAASGAGVEVGDPLKNLPSPLEGVEYLLQEHPKRQLARLQQRKRNRAAVKRTERSVRRRIRVYRNYGNPFGHIGGRRRRRYRRRRY